MNALATSNIAEIASANGLELATNQVQLLERYASLLLDWNQKVNLISRKDEENVFTNHILHSLTIAMPSLGIPKIPKNARVLDLGTGGGLPGIPLKIVRPDLSLLLCDSIRKKIAAVSGMLNDLRTSDPTAFANIAAICSRAESLARQNGLFDVIVTRAVAPLTDLVKWVQTISKPNSKMYALKGGNLESEVGEAKRLGRVRSIEVYPLALQGFDALLREEKKIVIVELK